MAPATPARWSRIACRFEPPPEAEPALLETADKGDDDETPPPDDGPKVVSLDQFRKK